MKKTDINRYAKNSYMKDTIDASDFTAGKKVKMLFKWFLTAFLIFVVAMFIVFSAILVFMYTNSKNSLNLDLRSLKIDLTSFIYVDDGNGNSVEYQPVYAGEKRVWVDYDNIPVAMRDAIVAIEDKRFYEHQGVDWLRTGGAVLNFMSSSDSYGGSTITQQLIKNLTNKTEVSITRKISEIINALKFEQRYTKDEILETYLNIVNFGSGCNGVQAAANKYFDKDISECSIAECACIAGITQNPSKYTPLEHPEANKKRQQVVLGEMLDQGKITQEEYTQAMYESEHMEFAEQTDDDGSKSNSVNNWYIESMLQDIAKDLSETMQIDEDTAMYMVMRGGYKIHCAIDLNAQKAAEDVTVSSNVLPSNKSIQLGYVMMDYDGRVLAIIGQRGEKEANLLWNCATTAKRQPGSSFKPIAVYAPALEQKIINYSTLVEDAPLYNIPGTSGAWPPNWYKSYRGYMTVQKALEISANAPAAQIAKKLTPEGCFKFVSEQLGFTSLNANEDCTYSGMATGSSYNGVTVREMVAAFQIFGNGGNYIKPYTYYYMEDHDGIVVLDNRTKKSNQAISAQNSTIMRKLLHNVVAGSEGTGTAANIPGTYVFAKTGTTDDNENSWFVGGTPYAVAGIWTGYETPTPMSDNEAAFAQKIWKSIMTAYITDLKYKDFTDADGVTVAQYCTSTGCLATTGCPSTATGYYTTGNIPGYCTTHGGNAKATDGNVSQNESSSSASSDSSSSESSSSEATSSQEPAPSSQTSSVSSQAVSSQSTSSTAQ